MKKRPALALATLLAIHATAYGATMIKPDIKLNPNPRMRYEITVTVDGAPGGFDKVTGHADFKVTNENCVPLTPVTGATVAPEKSVPLTYTREGPNTFKTFVFVDQIQDEDYFGKGVCRWSIVAAGINLIHQSVNFSPAIYHDDIVSEHGVVKYFSLKSYNSDGERIDIGADSPNAYNNPATTFHITMRAAEKLP